MKLVCANCEVDEVRSNLGLPEDAHEVEHEVPEAPAYFKKPKFFPYEVKETKGEDGKPKVDVVISHWEGYDTVKLPDTEQEPDSKGNYPLKTHQIVNGMSVVCPNCGSPTLKKKETK